MLISPAPLVLQLAAVETGIVVGLTIAAIVIGLVIGAFVIQMMTGNTIKRANEERERIIASARTEAETQREKTAVDAEKQILERKQSLEKEFTAEREQVKEQERRLAKREDMMDRKNDTLESKERFLEERSRSLDQKKSALQKRNKELDSLLLQQNDRLLQIADMTQEEAKRELLTRTEDECREEANLIAQRVHGEVETESKSKAREIVLLAIQRYAGEFATDSVVRTIPIPSDDMKGRIIGREGRNIRAIERATGVDVLVDDTPGLISVSCFDKVRQAIASESLQRLVEDGRVHPTRIEEVVEKVRSEIHERILTYGKDAANEAKIRSLHPKIIEAMGRLYYRTSFGQNMLKHSIEVAFLSQMIADQLGLDGTLARRCGFLHDIGKSMDHDMEGGHPKIGMEFCKPLRERDEVLNAIGGHHGDIPSISVYTPIVMAADAISGARPGARRESMEHYIQRLEQLEAIANEQSGVEEAYAIQAGREIRVIINAKTLSDSDAFGVAREIAKRVSAEMTFPGEIKVTVLRETRAVEYAT